MMENFDRNVNNNYNNKLSLKYVKNFSIYSKKIITANY